jgi:carbonic anhydrase
MSHGCVACVVICMDWRLHRRGRVTDLAGKIARRAGGPCDVITRDGAVQDLLRGAPGAADSLLRDLEAAANLHGVRAVYLVNHADCGAYRSFNFPGPQQERHQHEADLLEAAKAIRKRLPHVEVIPLFAALRAEGTGQYELHEVADRPHVT